MKTVTPRGYMDIKELAKRAGTAIPNLLALSRNNDPFFVGTEAHRAQAEWFVDIWQKYKFGDGVHLRRIHYQVVSQAVQAKSNTFEIDLPPRPEPETDPAEKDWLFDSKRGYMEQLSHYQERKKLA